ncbi:MAG: hypothetical protein IJ458_01625 [Clostridia bacterium]|nr:hypothetical protein [Clostridia bacterium]
MEKLAVIELGASEITFTKLNFTSNGFFTIEQQIKEPVRLTQDLERDGYIKSTRIEETISILKIFRKIMDNEGINPNLCYADPAIATARNQIAFLDEIYKTVCLHFRVLSLDEQVDALHLACLHSFSAIKGLVCQIGDDSMQIIQYNRRMVVNKCNIPYGALNLAEKFDSIVDFSQKMDKMVDFITTLLRKEKWLFELDEDIEFIGVGKFFEATGVLCRKSMHYPLDIAHNYEITDNNFKSIYGLIKTLDIDKAKKLKGVSSMRADVLASGIAIIKALFNNVFKSNVKVSTCGEMYGLVARNILSQAEKPMLDILGYSLSAINEFYPSGQNMNNIYDLSIILYKQLKVLHRLNRNYVKTLRIAASMCLSGKRISYNNYEKNGFNVILGSTIYGVSHNEILMAAFVVANQDSDNFSLSDWVRYKDILAEEDASAVKKLGLIVKIATLLNVTGSNAVKDIACDILGDTVILKTTVEKDAKLEISQAQTMYNDFKKIFGKNLQIL